MKSKALMLAVCGLALGTACTPARDAATPAPGNAGAASSGTHPPTAEERANAAQALVGEWALYEGERPEAQLRLDSDTFAYSAPLDTYSGSWRLVQAAANTYEIELSADTHRSLEESSQGSTQKGGVDVPGLETKRSALTPPMRWRYRVTVGQGEVTSFSLDDSRTLRWLPNAPVED